MTVVRGEVVVDHPHFLNSFFVGNDRCLVEPVTHHGESVQLNVVFKGAAAVDADRGKLRTARDTYSKRIEGLTARGLVPGLHAVLQRCVVERVLCDIWDHVDYL